VALHIFGHIYTNDRIFIAEDRPGESFGKLGLADARGPKEEERRDGTVLLFEPGAR
jgi:hypothetical protein